MMEKVQKPRNSECGTPLSKPFRIYWQDFCLLLAGFLLLLDLEDGGSTFLQNVMDFTRLHGIISVPTHHLSSCVNSIPVPVV
jgi:hypothetical protein